MFKVKRVYAPPEESDGFRVLVDRLWPRGVPKERGRVDLWLREVAPSDELRRWYSHDPTKWKEFQERYRAELEGKKEQLSRLKALESERKSVTLLFSSKETKYNNAVALVAVLRG